MYVVHKPNLDFFPLITPTFKLKTLYSLFQLPYYALGEVIPYYY